MEMDTSDVLLASLDELFGIENMRDSSYRKINEHFDTETGDRVIWFEYRFQVYNEATQLRWQNSILKSLLAKVGAATVGATQASAATVNGSEKP